MSVRLRFGILTCAIGLVGCTNAKPQFATLDGIPQPLYFGQVSHTISITSTTSDIPVSGTCDKRIDRMEFRIQGYQDWGPASGFANGAVTDDCKTNGTFAFNLKSLSAMSVWNLTQTVRFTLEAKSIYSVGDSNISLLKIEYVIPVGVAPGQFRMSQGGGASTSGSFSARSSIGFISGAKSSSSSFTVNRQDR